MTRSLFKLPYVHRSVFSRSISRREDFFKKNRKLDSMFTKLLAEKKANLLFHLFFWKRPSSINKSLSTKKIMIHNGQFFTTKNPSLISKGFKLGGFSITRKKPKHKGKKRQVKKVRAKVVKYFK